MKEDCASVLGYDGMVRPHDLDQVFCLDLGAEANVTSDRKWKELEDDDFELEGTEEMVALSRRVDVFAKSTLAIAIDGDPGTGKGRVARRIHIRSERKGGFVVVNCRSFTPELMVSQLFGHARGAFTGAVTPHEGVFKLAHEGTLFLDEVAELHPEVQAILLTVLDEKRFRPLGSSQEEAVDVRIVSASNKNLHAEVKAGRFRQDLLERLAGEEISLPPLRERKDAVERLAKRFWCMDRGPELPQVLIDEAAMRRIVAYPWPGNIRELELALERARVLAQGGLILTEQLLLSANPRLFTAEILEALGRRPGLGLAELGALTRLPMAEIQQFMRKLAREQAIQGTAATGYRLADDSWRPMVAPGPMTPPASVDGDEAQVLEYVLKHQETTRRAVEGLLGCSERHANEILTGLLKRGLLEMTQGGPRTRYRISR